jgi:hypothetical protein
MADTDSTQTDNLTNKFAGASLNMLVAFLDQHETKIRQDFEIIECVACGGESWANRLNLEGDHIDSISGGIFHAIINTTENVSTYIDLRDAINELRRIAAQQSASV